MVPRAALLALWLTFGAGTGALAAPQFEVKAVEVDDLKSVYATVRSRDLIDARVRTPGTIASLKVDEGVPVEQGQVVALVGDPKIALRIKAIEARMVAIQSQLDTARTELERAKALQQRGFASQARVDQAQTAYDVALNEHRSAEAERSVIETESQEGEVLAPTSGRVLKVPVTVGSVVMAGESIATIAANGYLLRLELPERHARFMKPGDPVRVGSRGLGPDEGPPAEGRITQVYPELFNGRVIADAEVPGLGAYFVGERVLVWISAGKRQAFLVPPDYVFKRFGLDYVRVEKADGAQADVVVQASRGIKHVDGEDRIEILAGIEAGDRLVRP